MSREAVQMALEALEQIHPGNLTPMAEETWNKAITALRQALETEQEPVAWMYVNKDGECEQIEYGPVLDDPGVTPLYAAPPKREWVGLTEEDMEALFLNEDGVRFARYIESRLKDKNA